MTNFKQFISRNILKVKAHSPAILFAAGVGFGIACVVDACKQTFKVVDDMEETNLEIQNAELTDNEEERALAVRKVRITGVCKVAKRYIRPAVFGVASVGCFAGQYRILSGRNIALMAAYTAVDQAYKQLQKNVSDTYGQDALTSLKNPIELQKGVDEQGNEITIVKNGDAAKPHEMSMYARYFDEASKEFTSDPMTNLMNLRNIQRWANDKLIVQGHLFLNEVYDMLDIPRSTAGAVVGWVISKNGGDNYVDFGLDNPWNPDSRDVVNGRSPYFYLDFNVDGVIYDLI